MTKCKLRSIIPVHNKTWMFIWGEFLKRPSLQLETGVWMTSSPGARCCQVRLEPAGGVLLQQQHTRRGSLQPIRAPTSSIKLTFFRCSCSWEAEASSSCQCVKKKHNMWGNKPASVQHSAARVVTEKVSAGRKRHVSVALVHRTEPRLGLVFFRLRPLIDPVLFVGPLLFVNSAFIKQD